MAISKLELERKIANGESVWYLDGKDVLEFHLTPDKDPKIMYDTILYVYGKENEDWHYKLYIDKLFATKEDAEWELTYGNIERVERLRLPRWEELENTDIFDEIYYTPKHSDFELNVYGKYIRLKLPLWQGDDKVWERTKENYAKACELAKKLFLGEDM